MSTDTGDLITFLWERLDEEERIAQEAGCVRWKVGPTFGALDNRVYVQEEGAGIDTVGTCVIAGQVSNTPWFRANAEHIALHDPARVLAEVAAKRQLLDLFEATNDRTISADAWVALRAVVHELAQIYAGHPGWRDEWKVTE